MRSVLTTMILAAQTFVDGWENGATGMGIFGRDRTRATEFFGDPFLTMDLCADLFHHDAVAARIASAHVSHALRGGVILSGKDASATLEILTEMSALESVCEALIWGRVFGGAALLLGTADGLDARNPLPDDAKLEFLNTYDRRDVQYDRDGYYRIQTYDPRSGVSAPWTVHPSRIERCGGVLTGDRERQQLQGWDASVFQRTYHDLRRFRDAYDNMGHMLSEASVGVFKMAGLISAIAGDRSKDITTRAALLDYTKSVARSVFLDAGREESYNRESIPFSGVPEVVDRVANLLAASSGIPVTILMGQAPAGLNATGDADVRNFYDDVQAYRRDEVAPILRRILRFVCVPRGLEPPTISWPSLWQQTPKEEAETRALVSTADTAYWNMGAAGEDTIRRSRWRSSGYSAEMLPESPAELSKLKPKKAPGLAPGAPALAPAPAPPPAVPVPRAPGA